MDQHYISKFYLEGFVDRKHTQKLYVFNKETARWTRRAPKKAAFHPDYYEDKERGVLPPRAIEDVLKVAESRAGKALKESLFLGKAPSSQERADIAYFIANVTGRIPAKHEAMAKYLAQRVLRAGVEKMRQNPGEFIKFKNHFIEEHGSFPISDDEFLDPAKISQDVEIDRFTAMAYSLLASGGEARALHNFDWIIIKATSNYCFVTSDNPVAYQIPDFPLRPAFGGYGYPNLLVTFPLSATHALAAKQGKSRTRFVDGDRQLVEAINLNSATLWHREIFCPTRDFPGVDFFGGALWMQGLGGDAITAELRRRMIVQLPNS